MTSSRDEGGRNRTAMKLEAKRAAMSAGKGETPRTEEVFSRSSSYTLAPSLLDLARELERELAAETLKRQQIEVERDAILEDLAAETQRRERAERLLKIARVHVADALEQSGAAQHEAELRETLSMIDAALSQQEQTK